MRPRADFVGSTEFLCGLAEEILYFLLESGPRLVERQIQITNSSLYLAYSFLNFHV